MRLMLAAILIAAAAYSGYWWVGSGREEAAIRAWFADQRGAAAESVSTTGYPNRFDTTVTAPELRMGDRTWTAPFLQLLRLSYQPGHYIVAVAENQTISSPAQTLDIATDRTRASVVYAEDTLDRLSVVVDVPRLSSDAGWTASADTLLVAMRRSGADGVELGLDVTALRMRDAPPFALHADGVLRRDESGRLSGTLSLRSQHWPATMGLLTALGWVPADRSLQVAEALFETHTADLTFADGRMSIAGTDLGPIPEFPLP